MEYRIKHSKYDWWALLPTCSCLHSLAHLNTQKTTQTEHTNNKKERRVLK